MGLKLYMKDKLLLRHVFQSKATVLILLGLLLFGFVTMLALVYGRPENPDYWTSVSLGDRVENLTFCEAVREDNFVRVPVNALSSYCFFAVGIICSVLFVADIRQDKRFEAQ